MGKTGVVASGLILVVLCTLAGCVGAPKYGSAVPSRPRQLAAPPELEADTYLGTLVGGSYAKGFGFSNMNVRLEVTDINGVQTTFYVRSDSQVFDRSGAPVNYLEASRGRGKQVEIRYFIIQYASGGDPSRSDFAYEIGQKGVATLHFLN